MTELWIRQRQVAIGVLAGSITVVLAALVAVWEPARSAWTAADCWLGGLASLLSWLKTAVLLVSARGRTPHNELMSPAHDNSFWWLLDANEQATLTAQGWTRVFATKTTLCSEGEPTTHVFILLEGWVKVVSTTADGRELLEALRGRGEIVGEIAGEVTGYRTATVRAVGKVGSLILPSEVFRSFLDSHPHAGQVYRRTLTERERMAYESRRDQFLSGGPQRLARLLLQLVGNQCEQTDSGIVTALPLSQEELASMIGVSRATLTRTLTAWRSRRIIQTSQRHITILDLPSVYRIAGRPIPLA